MSSWMTSYGHCLGGAIFLIEKDQVKYATELDQSTRREQENIEAMKEARKDEKFYQKAQKEQDEEDEEREKRLNYDKKWE